MYREFEICVELNPHRDCSKSVSVWVKVTSGPIEMTASGESLISILDAVAGAVAILMARIATLPSKCPVCSGGTELVEYSELPYGDDDECVIMCGAGCGEFKVGWNHWRSPAWEGYPVVRDCEDVWRIGKAEGFDHSSDEAENRKRWGLV